MVKGGLTCNHAHGAIKQKAAGGGYGAVARDLVAAAMWRDFLAQTGWTEAADFKGLQRQHGHQPFTCMATMKICVKCNVRCWRDIQFGDVGPRAMVSEEQRALLLLEAAAAGTSKKRGLEEPAIPQSKRPVGQKTGHQGFASSLGCEPFLGWAGMFRDGQKLASSDVLLGPIGAGLHSSHLGSATLGEQFGPHRVAELWHGCQRPGGCAHVPNPLTMCVRQASSPST